MRLALGQSFVSTLLPPRDIRSAIGLTLGLLLAACSSSAEKAAQEANLAQQMLDAGNLPIASAAIGRALAHGASDPKILLLDARIKARKRDLRGAYDAYRTVLVFEPKNFEALSTVAQIAQMMGEKAVARDSIRRAMAIEPENPEMLLTLGVMALDEKNYAEAQRLGDRILSNTPGDPRGLALKARALSLMGRGPEALKMLRDQIALSGNSSMTASALLETARAQGDVPTMLEQFPLLSENVPDSVELPLDEINIRYKSGDRVGARLASDDFIAKFGSQGDAMARLLDLWDEYDSEPLTAPGIAALAQKGAIEARLAVARFVLDRGDEAGARMLVANSADPRARGLLARLSVRHGNAEGAAVARAILKDDETNCEALTALAEWNLRRGDTDAAVVPAQVVAAQCRDRIDGYLILANAFQRANRAPAVERVSRDAIDTHPLDARVTRHFADWLLSRKRPDSAVAVARRLTTVAPSRESSWRVLASVCQRTGNAPCAGDAARGLAKAKAVYQLDPLPGVRAPDPLFGRTWR